jgi:hypothetical protein
MLVPLYLCVRRSVWRTVAAPFSLLSNAAVWASAAIPRSNRAPQERGDSDHYVTTPLHPTAGAERACDPLACVRVVPALFEVDVIGRESTFGCGASSTTLRFNDCRKPVDGLNAGQLWHGYGVRIRPAATLMVSPVIIRASSETRNSIVSTTSRTSPR